MDAATEGQSGVILESVAGGCLGFDLVAGFGNQHPVEQGRIRIQRLDDFPRRCEIFLHQDRRDEERITDIVETLTARAICGKFTTGREVHAEEIAHGVIVFVPIEAADGGAARIAGELAGFQLAKHGFDLADHGLAFIRSRQHVHVILGGHVADLDLMGQIFEEAVMAQGGIGGGQVMNLDAAFLFLRTVAGVAVFFEKWGGDAGEVVRRAGENPARDGGSP